MLFFQSDEEETAGNLADWVDKKSHSFPPSTVYL